MLYQVEFLEKERDNLQSQSESQAQLQHSQVDALEAVLETVTKEKEATKEHYEGLLAKERQQVVFSLKLTVNILGGNERTCNEKRVQCEIKRARRTVYKP